MPDRLNSQEQTSIYEIKRANTIQGYTDALNALKESDNFFPILTGLKRAYRFDALYYKQMFEDPYQLAVYLVIYSEYNNTFKAILDEVTSITRSSMNNDLMNLEVNIISAKFKDILPRLILQMQIIEVSFSEILVLVNSTRAGRNEHEAMQY